MGAGRAGTWEGRDVGEEGRWKFNALDERRGIGRMDGNERVQ